MAQEYIDNRTDSENKYMGKLDEYSVNLNNNIDLFVIDNTDSLNGAIDDVHDKMSTTFVLLLIGPILLCLASYVIPRNIEKQLTELQHHSLIISNGDLTKKVTGIGKDEIGQVATTFEQMRKQLHNLG